MRPGFERDIMGFSVVAKEEFQLQKETTKDKPQEQLTDDLDRLSKVLLWHLKQAVKRQHTSLEVQKEIYDIQKNKQEIMRRLKEQLACLDNPECQIEKAANERSVRFDEEINGFRYLDDNGREQIASFGEIMTDMSWGVNYNIDHNTPHLMSKKYLVERAKQELGELLDLQIIKNEISRDITHELKRKTYQVVDNERKSGVAKERSGFIAEIIVKNFLKKLSIDWDLPFEIREADIFQDVEQKIDFIIHRREESRGVNVETNEKAQDLGIQFSISPESTERKRHQIDKSMEKLKRRGEHIRDIALVIFPLDDVRALKRQWKESGRVAGGPDKFLSKDVAKKLFYELLKDIFESKEIEDAWQKVENNFPERNQ